MYKFTNKKSVAEQLIVSVDNAANLYERKHRTSPRQRLAAQRT